MENSGKICWNWWRVEKSFSKCEKMTIFGKSLKNGKIWTNFEKYFLPHKIKNGKFKFQQIFPEFSIVYFTR